MWQLLIGLLWGVSLIMLPGNFNGFWTPKAHLWLLGSFAIATSAWWSSPKGVLSQNRWIGYLLLYLLLLFGWTVLWPQLWVPGTTEHFIRIPWVQFPILPTMMCLGSLMALESLIRQSENFKRWVTIASHLCLVAGVLAGYGLLQRCGLDPYHLGARAVAGYVTRADMITTFGNPMLTANFLAICAPLCLMFKPKRFLLIFGLILLDLLLIRNRASLLAMSSALLLLFFWGKQRKFLWLLLGMIGLGSLSFWHRITLSLDSGRLAVWQRLLEEWWKQPWIGYGLGAMDDAVLHGTWAWASAHNEFIQLLFETGLLGLGLSLLAIGSTLWRCCRCPQSLPSLCWMASALSFGIVAFFGFPLRIGSMCMVGVCIWAALETYAGGQHATSYPA